MIKLYSIVFNRLCILLASLFLLGAATANDKVTTQKIKAFIPPDYEVMEFATGDLNGDKYPDYVLILKSTKEVQNPNEVRPLLLIKGNAKGKLELMARNDQVVLCSGCGGVMGDPSPKVSIKDKLLSIENSVGSNWRYTRIITFKFDNDLAELVLHKDTGVSYHVSQPNNQKNTVTNKDDFDKLPFTSYSYNKGF